MVQAPEKPEDKVTDVATGREPVTNANTDWKSVKVEQFADFTEGDVMRAIAASNANALSEAQLSALSDVILKRAKVTAKTVRNAAKTAKTAETQQAIDALAVAAFHEAERIFGRGCTRVKLEIIRNEAGQLDVSKTKIMSPVKNALAMLPVPDADEDGAIASEAAEAADEVHGTPEPPASNGRKAKK